MNRRTLVLNMLLMAVCAFSICGCAKKQQTSLRAIQLPVIRAKLTSPVFLLQGTVADRYGKPVSHAPVALIVTERSSLGSKSFIQSSTKADKRGFYSFPSRPWLQIGDRTVSLVTYLPGKMLGWSPPVGTWDISDHTSVDRRVTVFPLGKYSGSVVDPDGRPIRRALVRFVRPCTDGKYYAGAESTALVAKSPYAITMANGEYQLDGVPLGCGEPVVEAS